MSVTQSKLWLDNHPDTLPTIQSKHLEILRLLGQEHQSQVIVQYAASDPGLSLALLKQVNASRGSTSGREIVESVRAAIALLGEPVTHTLFKNHPVAEQQLTDPQQLFLYQQIINRSLHNETQIAEWAQATGHQQAEQLKLCALLFYCGEALCCVYAYENYRDYVDAGSLAGSEKKYFGFSFAELTQSVCEKLNLPELIIQAQPHNNDKGQRAQLLLLTSTICHQCEHGWYTDKLEKSFEQLSELLQLPLDMVISKFHQLSILAANTSALPEAWQPASRLILTQDKVWTPAPEQELTKRQALKTDIPRQAAQDRDDIFKRISLLLKQDGVSQSDILKEALSALFKDLKMSKVSLFLLSRDKQLLHNRMTLGLPDDSPFRQFQIEVSRAGLLKILLNKPQAIWVNETNFKKYQQLIPQSLLAGIMTNNFFAMSLFIEAKPIGIVYADRSANGEVIQQQTFSQFKQLISLTSKALTLLSKK